MINLDSKQFEIVANILRQFIPNKKIMVFGSRIKGTSKEFADLDLCVVGDQPLSSVELINLKEAFSNSDLPFRVDIVDWMKITQEFKDIIMQDVEVFKYTDRS